MEYNFFSVQPKTIEVKVFPVIASEEAKQSFKF